MTDRAFRLVNVFAESRLAGNALCVFEDADGLDEATMQALALQFNLSETTFILPSSRATARVRIFTPTFEMPFAGHPTLGSAHVVRELTGSGDSISLEMKAGVIAVAASGDVWTLQANAPKCRTPDASAGDLATMLGLERHDLSPHPFWIDTGTEQLVIPLATPAAVQRAAPNAELMLRHVDDPSRAMAYVFARRGNKVLARFFFQKHGAIVEDPGTGSACANLGGWLIATGAALPQQLTIDQGRSVGRACRLGLEVSADKRIRVFGRVIEIGRGVMSL